MKGKLEFINRPFSPDFDVVRYMDLPEFLQLLTQKSLCFQNNRNLRKGDRLEGHFSKEKLFDTTFREFVAFRKAFPGLSEREYLVAWEKVGPNIINAFYFICLTMGLKESMAMWKIYGNNGKGISVRMNLQKLLNTSEVDKVYLGKIVYADLKTLRPVSPALKACFYKFKSYSYEKEIRIGILDRDTYFDTGNDVRIVKVESLEAIEEVKVGPGFEWLKPIVDEVLRKFGISLNVVLSEYNI